MPPPATAAPTAFAGPAAAPELSLANAVRGAIAATLLPMRYALVLACWAFFLALLITEPVLRLPLLLYLASIFSPAGRSAAAASRWPPVMRQFPVYRWYKHWAPGSRLVKTADLDPSRRYFFGMHPHGVLGNYTILALGTEGFGFGELFPGIRVSQGILELILLIPFREMCIAHGWVGVSRRSLLRALASGPGAAVAVVVGGAAEAELAEPGTMDLVLLKRKGFVSLALQAGADLVPVLCFGENEAYHRVLAPPGSRLAAASALTKKYFGFTLPLAYGRGILGLRYGPLPERVPLVVVVGAPLQLPAFAGDLRSPEGQALVDACHARYCQALQQLYDEHKQELAQGRKRDMRFVS